MMMQLEIQRERLISLVQDLVRIESHYLVEGGENRVGEYLAELALKACLDVEFETVKDGRKNFYATLKGDGTSSEKLLFCGHLDTVRPDGMAVPPFTGEVRDGKILGRGSADMKGGIGAMIYALLYLKENKIPLKGDLIFAGTIGEECPDASEGGQALGKKKNVATMAVVGEATELNIAVAHKGTMWLKVTLKGRAAHGSMPHLGDNAIYKCTEFVEKIRTDLLPKLALKEHPLCGKPTLNVGRIEGGMQNNIVPDVCYFSLDRRYIPGETKEELFQELYDVGASIGLSKEMISIEAMEETLLRCPLETNVESEVVQSLLSVTKEAGLSSKVYGVDYWTDGAHLGNAQIPTIVFGPGNIREAHSAHEFLEIDSLLSSALCYLKLAIKVLG